MLLMCATLMEINNMLDRSLVLLSRAETAQQQQHEINCGDGSLFVLKITPGRTTTKNCIELHGSDGRIYEEIEDTTLQCEGHATSIEYYGCRALEIKDGAPERVQKLLNFDFNRFTVLCTKTPEIGLRYIKVILDLTDISTN